MKVQVDFVSEGTGPTADVRVRRLLKSALRSFGLRCTGIRELTPEPTPAAQDQGTPRCTLATLAGVEALPVHLDTIEDK